MTRGLSELERLAVLVAIEAPETGNPYAHAARIPWATIAELRAELERRGIDWRAMVRRRLEIEAERRAVKRT